MKSNKGKGIKKALSMAYESGKKESIRTAVKYSVAVPFLVLRDEFGFGKQRIKRFYENYIKVYESIDEEYLDLDDIIKTIKEETGFNIFEDKR